MCRTRKNFARDVDRRATLVGLAATSAFLCMAAKADAKANVVEAPSPGPRDTCPVCGMFVARYPHWVAVIVFKDGKTAYFDGAKDFFKFILDLPKYEPGRSQADIATMAVTDYYTTDKVVADEAIYVLGSDVLGPMGHELVPQADEASAKDFIKDHQGKRILRYSDVDMKLLLALDDGRFE